MQHIATLTRSISDDIKSKEEPSQTPSTVCAEKTAIECTYSDFVIVCRRIDKSIPGRSRLITKSVRVVAFPRKSNRITAAADNLAGVHCVLAGGSHLALRNGTDVSR
jgi:hypothetical protein